MPNYTAAELRQRTCADRLLLAVDGHIYNVTDFVGRHPGGAGLLEKYAGRDVTDVLRDDTSHVHTATAYHVLEKYHIGELVDDSESAVRQRVSTPDRAPVRAGPLPVRLWRCARVSGPPMLCHFCVLTLLLALVRFVTYDTMSSSWA